MALLQRYSLYFTFILSALELQRVSCKSDIAGSLDDIIVEFVNASYIDEDTLDISVNYKNDGRNSLRVHVDLINELPEHVFLKMKVWGRAFGQYKLPTGISIDVDICDGKLKRYFIENLLGSMGVDTKECPPKPGSYGLDDYVGQMDGLPIYAFVGLDILVDVEIHSPPDISILKAKGYGRIF